MFEGTVNLTPSLLATAGRRRAHQHVGAATRECMKQRVVCSAYSAAQLCLNRPPDPASDSAGCQMLGNPYQVIGVHDGLLPYTSSQSDFSTKDRLGTDAAPSSMSFGHISPYNPSVHAVSRSS